MYAKPCVIVAPILHILIPNKKWMGKHLLWSLDIIQECIWKVWQILGFWGFISPCIFPILYFENLYIWPQTLGNLYPHYIDTKAKSYLLGLNLSCYFWFSACCCAWTTCKTQVDRLWLGASQVLDLGSFMTELSHDELICDFSTCCNNHHQ